MYANVMSESFFFVKIQIATFIFEFNAHLIRLNEFKIK